MHRKYYIQTNRLMKKLISYKNLKYFSFLNTCQDYPSYKKRGKNSRVINSFYRQMEKYFNN